MFAQICATVGRIPEKVTDSPAPASPVIQTQKRQVYHAHISNMSTCCSINLIKHSIYTYIILYVYITNLYK